MKNLEDAWKAKKDKKYELGCKENLFLYHIAIPVIFEKVSAFFQLNEIQTRASLGGEYYAKFPERLSFNPFRRQGHPFPKSITARRSSPSEIYNTWLQETSLYPKNQAYPDLALRSPAPTSIVFDIKYFEKGDEKASIVDGLYEVSYYRSLINEDDPGKSQYEFGCLLAYDASKDRRLVSAWDKIADKGLFWSGANIFPIIISEEV